MIKVNYALHRLSSMSAEEFHRYWAENHSPIVGRHATALGIRRYVQAHTMRTALDEQIGAARSMQLQPFDGIAELYFDSVEALAEALSSPAGQVAGAELIEDERKFVDLSRSLIWVTDERVFIDDMPA